jgi:hypothetical protein
MSGSDKTSLGDRMKWYEKRYSHVVMPMIPVMARIDGRSFSKFTAGLARPYDERMSRLMIDTTKFLVEQTNARCGYTQSDEITLVWLAEDPLTCVARGAGLIYEDFETLSQYFVGLERGSTRHNA